MGQLFQDGRQVLAALQNAPIATQTFRSVRHDERVDPYAGVRQVRPRPCLKACRRNNELVRETAPSDRLLVFTPPDGWDPLCQFLDVPVPKGDFSRSNAREEFCAQVGGEPEDA